MKYKFIFNNLLFSSQPFLPKIRFNYYPYGYDSSFLISLYPIVRLLNIIYDHKGLNFQPS